MFQTQSKNLQGQGGVRVCGTGTHTHTHAHTHKQVYIHIGAQTCTHRPLGHHRTLAGHSQEGVGWLERTVYLGDPSTSEEQPGVSP